MKNAVMKAKMGRPTVYRNDFPVRTITYIQRCEKENIPPTVAGLSLELGISKERAYAFGKKYEDFSNALDILRSMQEKMLITKSLAGEWNPTISKLLLHNHGYTEKVQAEVATVSVVFHESLRIDNTEQ